MQKIAIASRKNLESHRKVFERIVKHLQKLKKDIYLEERVAELIQLKKYQPFIPGKTEVDLVLVMGGDGTILRVVNLMKDIKAKFFGINMGRLGFLSEIPPVQVTKILDRIFAKKYTLDKRMMLCSKLKRGKKVIQTFHSLNEVVITQGTLSRLIYLKTKVGGKKLTNYKADGLIVATPTGSTAYSLSAGGPIVHPGIPAMIITPICPHSFSQKPIVIPDDKKVEILVDSDYEQINLTIDGQQSVCMKYKDVLEVNRYKEVEFIRLLEESYFSNLREKLGWGEGLDKSF